MTSPADAAKRLRPAWGALGMDEIFEPAPREAQADD